MASSSRRLEGNVVGLGLKLHSTESFPLGMMMSHHRPLSSSEAVDGDGGAGAGGPTYGHEAKEEVRSTGSMSNIYRDDVTTAAAVVVPSGGAFVRTFQPLDISSSNISNTTFKPPVLAGGGMAATLGFPFTSAQWKELERQAMIYKYMLAALPVPPDLLLPTNFSADPSATHSSLGGGSLFNTRLSVNKDPEPGRCKRTDGKKWRCSRDVAPNQKYCERHMHRGRPRSRKPVEVHAPPNNSTSTTTSNNKKGRLHNSPFPSTPTDFPTPTFSSPQLLGSTIQSNDQNTSASLFKEPNRGLQLGMENETVTIDAAESQWQHLMETNIGLTTGASVLQQDYVLEPLSLISYSDFGGRRVDQEANECNNLFLNPVLLSLEKQSQMDTSSRGFIDAWSSENPSNTNNNSSKKSSVTSHGNLSPSSLTLSMAMATGNVIDEEMKQIQMDVGVKDSVNTRGQDLSWLSAVPWVASTPGGPLAEVLRPSAVLTVGSSDPTSPSCCTGNGDSISPQVTTVSSPSGVLHRTMLSLSDGSVCNSPTIAASTATPENVAFHWLS